MVKFFYHSPSHLNLDILRVILRYVLNQFDRIIEFEVIYTYLCNVDLTKIKSYIDSFRYGSPPHGGGGIGMSLAFQSTQLVAILKKESDSHLKELFCL